MVRDNTIFRLHTPHKCSLMIDLSNEAIRTISMVPLSCKAYAFGESKCSSTNDFSDSWSWKITLCRGENWSNSVQKNGSVQYTRAFTHYKELNMVLLLNLIAKELVSFTITDHNDSCNTLTADKTSEETKALLPKISTFRLTAFHFRRHNQDARHFIVDIRNWIQCTRLTGPRITKSRWPSLRAPGGLGLDDYVSRGRRLQRVAESGAIVLLVSDKRRQACELCVAVFARLISALRRWRVFRLIVIVIAVRHAVTAIVRVALHIAICLIGFRNSWTSASCWRRWSVWLFITRRACCISP